MRFITTRGRAPAASLEFALFDGLAPDGGLYVPESLTPWTAGDLERLPGLSLTELAIRVLRPFVSEELTDTALDEPRARCAELSRHAVALNRTSRSSCFMARRSRSRTSVRA
jgi:threonine synthase